MLLLCCGALHMLPGKRADLANRTCRLLQGGKYHEENDSTNTFRERTVEHHELGRPLIYAQGGHCYCPRASFVIYSPLRISTAKAAYLANEIKSESQYRTEAGLYESALGAIAGIATLKLDTPNDLKQALAIFDRARPGLKFFSSKLVVIAISDSAFSGAVKKKASSKLAAEAFLEELKADPKVVSRLDGAATLTTRLQQTAQADAAILRRVAERLKDAAERIKNTSQRQ